jgi:hypothetical protein
MNFSTESSERDTLTIRRDALLDKKRVIDAVEKLKERAPAGKILQTNLRYFVRSTHISDYGALQSLFEWFNGEGIGEVKVSRAGTSVTGGWGQYGVEITLSGKFETYAKQVRDEYHSVNRDIGRDRESQERSKNRGQGVAQWVYCTNPFWLSIKIMHWLWKRKLFSSVIAAVGALLVYDYAVAWRNLNAFITFLRSLIERSPGGY